jgi:hypothetical protein
MTAAKPIVTYENSEQRRRFLLALSDRLTRTVEFAADDPSRQGSREDHTYSLTAESVRFVFKPPIA